MSESSTALIVEDQQPIQLLIKRLASRSGCDVLTAESVAEAIRLVETNSFDLAFIDFMLPDGEGVEIARKLRAVTPHARINLVTARGEDSIKTLALEAGCDRVIMKPFSIHEILAEFALLKSSDRSR